MIIYSWIISKLKANIPKELPTNSKTETEKSKESRDKKDDNYTDKIKNEISQLKQLTKEANKLIIEKLDNRGK